MKKRRPEGRNTVEVIITSPASPNGNSKNGAGQKPRCVPVAGKAETGSKEERRTHLAEIH